MPILRSESALVLFAQGSCVHGVREHVADRKTVEYADFPCKTKTTLRQGVKR